MVKRGLGKGNMKLLEQLIIAVNYSGLLETDIDEIVKSTRIFFIEQGFHISEGIHKNINLQLNDPETLEGTFVSNAEMIRKYVYSCENITINITKESLDMLVTAGIDYKGFEKYKEYLAYIINKMEEDFKSIINITRIGVRKINGLFIKDMSLVSNYFKNEIVNCIGVKGVVSADSGDVFMSTSHHTIFNTQYKVNIATETQIGEAKEMINNSVHSFNVHRIMLDIDVYWDKEVEEYTDVSNKLSSLNDKATDIYLNCLNDEFKNSLLNDNVINDTNIFGGVK